MSGINVVESVELPRFDLGTVVSSVDVHQDIENGSLSPLIFLKRHSLCDWGDLCEDDIDANNESLKDGSRLFSSYHLDEKGESKLWIITEADRSVTTLLYPHEY